jgi:hypothetical protein
MLLLVVAVLVVLAVELRPVALVIVARLLSNMLRLRR